MMNIALIIVIILLSFVLVILAARLFSIHKRIKVMQDTLDGMISGQNKLQIFTDQQDDLGNLAFRINELAALYGSAQEKYEK